MSSAADQKKFKFTQDYPTERKDYRPVGQEADQKTDERVLLRESAGERNEELHPYDTSENTPSTPDFNLGQATPQTPTAAVNLEKSPRKKKRAA